MIARNWQKSPAAGTEANLGIDIQRPVLEMVEPRSGGGADRKMN